MKRKGFKANDVAYKLGISRKAFWEKRTGRSEFKQSEIQGIINLLGISDPNPIFFGGEVSEKTLNEYD